MHLKRGCGKSKVAQSSVEFLIILIVVLFIFLFIIQMNSDYVDDMSIDYNANLLKTALNDISITANDLYRQGDGAKKTITVTLPRGVTDSTINHKTLSYELTHKGISEDFFTSLDFQVVGDLPIEAGIHKLEITAKSGYVIVNEKYLDINPVFLSLVANKTSTSTTEIEFSNAADNPYDVSVTFSGDPVLENNITFTNNFVVNPSTTYDLEINLTVPSFAAELRYYGVFEIFTEDQVTGSNETIFVDFVVDLVHEKIEIQNNAAFIYPTRWDNTLVPDQKVSQNFILCSGFPFLEQYNVTFSNDQVGSWLSFDENTKQSLITLDVSSNECESFTVYQHVNTSFEGTYVGAISSLTPDDVSMNTLVYTEVEADNILPNITSINMSTTFGVVDDEVCLYVNASDNSEIETVWVSIEQPDNLYMNVYLNSNSTCPNSTGLYSGKFTLAQGGYYYLNQTFARDISGNIANFTANRIIFSKQVIFRETPIFATEETNPSYSTDTWDHVPFEAEGDGNFAITQDEGGYIPDYVEYTWGDFDVADNENISQLKLTFIHRDRFNDDGVFDYNDPNEDRRHKIECYKDGSWMFLETYGINRDPTVWNTYELLDLSRCIDSPSDLDGFRMRIMFDPADQAGGSYSDVDLVELMAVITSTEAPNLWELAVDNPQPVDFTNGLNATANTFGLSGNNDGWDYIDNIYTTDSTAPSNFVLHGDPSDFSNYRSSSNRLEIVMGENSADEYHASGAWGIEFEITDTMYDLISKGAHMFYSFNYYVEDLDQDFEEACWVKTRFNGTYLGWDLDGHPDHYMHYSDDTLDVHAISGVYDHEDGWDEVIFRSFGWDVTHLITASGWYYLDFGGKIDYRSRNNVNGEGCGVYFDNVRLMIVE